MGAFKYEYIVLNCYNAPKLALHCCFNLCTINARWFYLWRGDRESCTFHNGLTKQSANVICYPTKLQYLPQCIRWFYSITPDKFTCGAISKSITKVLVWFVYFCAWIRLCLLPDDFTSQRKSVDVNPMSDSVAALFPWRVKLSGIRQSNCSLKG